MFLLFELYIFLISYTPPKKVPNTFYFFISEGIFDQISIALYFISLAPELERCFGKENCRSLAERLLLLVKHSESGNNI